MFPDEENNTNGIEGTKSTVDQFGNSIFTANPALVNTNNPIANPAPPRLKLVYKMLEVSTVQGAVSATLNLDSKIKLINGVALTTNKDELINNVRTELNINGSEVLPEDFGAALLATSLTVRPDDRYMQLNQIPGNGIIKIVARDSSNPFTTQKLNFTFRCLSE